MIINLTNVILDTAGDVAEEKHFLLHNHSFFDQYETLLKISVPARQSQEVTLIGEIAYQQLVKNIEQINALNPSTTWEIEEILSESED